MTDFTPTFRRTSYPTINPTNPSNSQSGRTILVTGASDGIGLGIAQAYAQANAAKVILCSRSQAKLDQAVAQIKVPKTELLTRAFDASSLDSITELWTSLQQDDISIDFLVLNASAMDNPGPESPAGLAAHFHFNITARIFMLSHFLSQPNPTPKILIDISSAALHCYPFTMPAYSASKAGFTAYLNHLSTTVPPDQLRIHSLHPGSVYTAAARSNPAFNADSVIWDDPSLSAHMALWLSTEAAAFLHGRFVWANWDVEELVGTKERLGREAGLLRIGVGGVEGFGIGEFMRKCEEVPTRKKSSS